MEKFFGTKFEMWKMKMKHLVIVRDLREAMDENVMRPTDPTIAIQYDVMDRKTKGLIRMCLADSILINVHEKSTSKNLWKKRSEMHQEKSLANNIFLRKKLYS